MSTVKITAIVASMRWGETKIFALAVIIAWLAGGCIFGATSYKGVMSYRDGRVYIRHDNFYRVGKLPEGWERMRSGARVISFYNDSLKSSVSTDAFCGRAVGDRRLDALGGEILSALDERTVISEKTIDLDGRGASRQVANGKLDGVPVQVDLVVAKKNGCTFDFYAVTPRGADPRVTEMFEQFFGGFSYR